MKTYPPVDFAAQRAAGFRGFRPIVWELPQAPIAPFAGGPEQPMVRGVFVPRAVAAAVSEDAHPLPVVVWPLFQAVRGRVA